MTLCIRANNHLKPRIGSYAAEKMIDRSSQLTGRGRRLLAARYQAALGIYLGMRRPDKSGTALDLGHAALDGGLVTLDVAAMHGRALSALADSHNFANMRNGSLKRAGSFLIQALTPMETAQREWRETNRELRRRNETLHRLTIELTKGARRLQREVARRMAGELAVRKGREQYRALFLESQIIGRCCTSAA